MGMMPETTAEQRKQWEELRVKIKLAQDRFNAMDPEEQRNARLAQRRSWMLGETMLEHPEMTRERAEELVDGCLRDAGYI